MTTLTPTYEIMLTLYCGECSEKHTLVSQVHGRQLYSEAFDNFTDFAAIGSKSELNLFFNTEEALQKYFQTIKEDDRTISIEKWEN